MSVILRVGSANIRTDTTINRNQSQSVAISRNQSQSVAMGNSNVVMCATISEHDMTYIELLITLLPSMCYGGQITARDDVGKWLTFMAAHLYEPTPGAPTVDHTYKESDGTWTSRIVLTSSQRRELEYVARIFSAQPGQSCLFSRTISKSHLDSAAKILRRFHR